MDAPLLTFLVLTEDFLTIDRVTRALTAQSIAGRIELVAVCPAKAACDIPPELASRLARVLVVESPLLPMGEARAAGVRSATAPIVMLGETHAFPAPDWGEQIVRAHEAGCDAVAPGISNSNPASALSWCALLMDYGRWLDGRSPGPIVEPPAYNAAWKRQALLRAGDGLARMLEPGGPRDPKVASGAQGFHHAPGARVAHLNVARPGAWAAERYWGGRLFGARRSLGWPLTRRIAYGAGSLLIPFIRFVRTRPAVSLARQRSHLPRGVLAAVAAGSVLWAIGEAAGYLAGEGRSEARMLEYELHKERYG